MRIDLLQATNLRCFENASFVPSAGVNWLVGPNGAGKTTLLEAAHILSHGRSFRGGGRSAPCRQGARGYTIHAGISRTDGTGVKLGLARAEDNRWRARLDGIDLATLAPLFEACPVVCFGPDSQALITGAADERRSFLDWSVFHVEHASLELWRAWRRGLRQRNALLRSHAADDDFSPWERELARVAVPIHVAREACLKSLKPYLIEESSWLVPELGEVHIEYRPGWDASVGLQQQLDEERPRDRERGYTQHGAHRADWSLRFSGIARREHLSRGQAKAIALVCILAQTRWLHDQTGDFPLLCLDDLESELDEEHVRKIIAWLAGKPLQAWLTTTKEPTSRQTWSTASVFHVEHAGITRALERSTGETPNTV